MIALVIMGGIAGVVAPDRVRLVVALSWGSRIIHCEVLYAG